MCITQMNKGVFKDSPMLYSKQIQIIVQKPEKSDKVPSLL